MDTFQSWVAFDQQEVDKLSPNEKFIISERADFVEVKRVIGLSEKRNYLPNINSYDGLYLRLPELKQAFIEADVLFLSGLGYYKLEMLELAPGSTAISYRLRGVRKD